MAKTKTVKVQPEKTNANLQIIVESVAGVPLFEPPAKEARIQPKPGTPLDVVKATITGSGKGNPQYFYIASGKYQGYFIKKEDTDSK
jgi:hypothetical protein